MGFWIGITPIYTGALHVQLKPEDRALVTPGGKPMAFSNTDISGDVLWGSLDRTGVLTVGFGDSKDPSQKDAVKAKIQDKLGQMLPALRGKYAEDDMTFVFNPMSTTENYLPVAGRLADFDVSTGWCGRGIAQSFAFGKAYAKHVVLGQSDDLKLFESLNIGPAPRVENVHSMAGQFIGAVVTKPNDAAGLPATVVGPLPPKR